MVSFEFEQVARCGSSHGVKGGIKFAGEEAELERCIDEGFVFIRLSDGSPVPFRVQSVDRKGAFILFLETIDSPEKAKELSDRPILLPIHKNRQALRSDGVNVDLHGFELFDEASGTRAQIVEVLDYPGQLMAKMEGGQLIPLHEDLIVKIEPEKQKITVSLALGIWSQSN